MSSSRKQNIIIGLAVAVVLGGLLIALQIAYDRLPPPSWNHARGILKNDFPDVRHVTLTDVQALLDAGEPVVFVDVRLPEEIAVSRIPGAIVAPAEITAGSVDQFREAAAEIHPDPDKAPVFIFYGAVGFRSAAAARAARAAGLANVSNFDGSIFAWANAGLPLETPAGTPAAAVHPYNDYWGQLLHPSRKATPSSQ